MTGAGKVCYIGGTLLKGGADMAEVAMGGILLAASYTDWKKEKIPNRLILMGMVPLLAAFMQSGSLRVAGYRVLAMAFVFFFCWQIYLLGGLGAGDVKLLMVLAGVCGLDRLLYIALIAFLLAVVHIFLRNLALPEGKRRRTVILAPFVFVAYALVMAGRWVS